MSQIAFILESTPKFGIFLISILSSFFFFLVWTSLYNVRLHKQNNAIFANNTSYIKLEAYYFLYPFDIFFFFPA